MRSSGNETAFELHIPRGGPAISAVTFAAQRPEQRRTVLIVDDDPDLRASLSDFFHDQGYTVETESRGRLALERIRKAQRPCVVILDLQLDGADGAAIYGGDAK